MKSSLRGDREHAASTLSIETPIPQRIKLAEGAFLEMMKRNKASLAIWQVEIWHSILSSHTRKENNCQQIETRALTHETTSRGRWEHPVREIREKSLPDQRPLSPSLVAQGCIWSMGLPPQQLDDFLRVCLSPQNTQPLSSCYLLGLS